MKLAALPLAFALVLGVSAAAAAPPTPDAHARALALKQAGDERVARKQYVEALEAYDQSFALEPSPALHYNRGRALEFLARYPEAVDAFRRFDAEASAELKAKVPNLGAHVAELDAKIAAVTFRVSVPGARVLVGGREVGRAPLAGTIRVNAGKTTVEAVADGYLDWHGDVNLEGGKETAVDVTMTPRDATATLVVRSPVASARVSIDGRFVGLVPAEAKLAAGTHPLLLQLDGYQDASTQVVLLAGERRELSVELTRTKPITSRWWFWTGIGVIVAGAAAGGIYYALTTERGAPSGNFSPGQLSF